MLCAVMLAAISLAAKATPVTWDWSWEDSSAVVIAHGTLTTLGEATTPEPVLGITGEVRGVPISGLVPVGTNPHYGYDNLFQSTDPFVDAAGVLIGLTTGELDLLYRIPGFGGPKYLDFSESPTGSFTEVRVFPKFTERQNSVPEPGTLSLAGIAIASMLGFIRRRV